MAEISITKQAAAQREIDAAVRMLFLHQEDLLAIHTVASAARTIVMDLANKKGVGRLHQTRQALEKTLGDAVTALKRSSETGEALEDGHRETLAWAIQTIEGKEGEVPSSFKIDLCELDPSSPDIALAIDHRAEFIEKDKRTREYRNRVANFLKHADRDGQESLDFGEIDVFFVVADAINYWILLNLSPTDEMNVYFDWFLALSPQTPDQVRLTKAGPLHLLPAEDQIDAGRHTLEALYRERQRSAASFRHSLPGGAKSLTAGRIYRPLE